ncbi:hypothetical protein [Fodinicola acaciae]|uniref:hypothetical protein n=1 Tax=Fodinicola acaciae TaxID=2681555 RepID=UPI0013D4B193|nr:hypothetical protein [Fodinicola acaciae]
MRSYQGINPRLSERLTAAGPDAQRRVASAIVTMIADRVPVDGAFHVVQAIAAEQFGASDLTNWLADAQDASQDQYEALRDERDALDEAGKPWPAQKQAELTRHRMAARAYEVFASALDRDADEAAQEAAYVAQTIISPDEIETLIREATAES